MNLSTKIFASFVVLCCSSTLLLAQVAKKPGKTIRVTCVGDSNTQRGYPALLQKMLGKGWLTQNCGIGAATVIDGTMRPYHKMKHYKAAMSSNPDYVIIMLGTNDANPRWWVDTRKSDFKGDLKSEFNSRYRKLVEDLQGVESKPQVIVAIPLAVYPEKAKVAVRENAKGRKAQLQNDIIPIIREIASAKGLTVVDVQASMGDAAHLSTDGVHFSRQGYTKMSEAFRDALLAAEKSK